MSALSTINELLEFYISPLVPLLSDPTVTDICINAPDKIYVERRGRLELTEFKFNDERELMALLETVATSLNKPFDRTSAPILDAMLIDGSRLAAVLPPISVGTPTVTIRPRPSVFFSMTQLVEKAALTQEMADYLQGGVERGANIVVAGGTGSGKTTLLRAVTSFVPTDERVFVIEDTTEQIAPFLPHVINFQASGKQIGFDRETVSMADLIKTSLRGRPDRIIIGEIRTPAAASAFVEAINTGHAGTITTIHANSAEETYTRLTSLLVEATSNVPIDAIRDRVTRNVDIVVHVARFKLGDERRRCVSAITTIDNGTPRRVFSFDPILRQHATHAR
jgi:pilus assembly protein CpaF